MVIVINGSNRAGNLTQIISKFYHQQLEALETKDLHYYSLEDLPVDMLSKHMFTENGRNDIVTDLQERLIIPSTKIVFILPEYNGGMPGALKLFIDACSTYKKDENFMNKKVAMIGVAAGRAGNLRGMEHLTSIMNYMGAVVMPNRLPVSSIRGLIDIPNMKLIDEPTKKVLQEHAKSFSSF